MALVDVGHQALLLYDMVDDPLWHARLLLAPIGHDWWVVLSPDYDIFPEQLSIGNTDLAAIRFRADSRAIPLGIAADSLYDFNEYPRGRDLAHLTFEGRALAAAERAVDVVEKRPGQSQAVSPVQSAAEQSLRASARCGELPDAWPPPPPAEAMWLARSGPLMKTASLEPGAWTILCGRWVERSQEALPAEERTAPGRSRCSTTTMAPGCGPSPAPSRTPPRTSGRSGPFGGRVRRPWCASSLRSSTAPPTNHHQVWRTTCKLSVSDAGLAEHECLCRALEGGACFDQINLYKSVLVETLVRKLQLIEEKHKDRMCAGPGQTEFGDDSHLFLGAESGRGVCISPALQAWVAGELGRESAILKERRKAREEWHLSRPHAKAKSGGGGKGGDGAAS